MRRRSGKRAPITVKAGSRTMTVVSRRMVHLFGKTDWVPPRGHGKILIDSSLKGVPALSTLLHEAIHCLNWGFSEKRVLHLEYALTSLVLSNPKVFAALAAHAPIPPRRRR